MTDFDGASASRRRDEAADEITPLVDRSHLHPGYGQPRRRSSDTASSILTSRLSRDELALADTAVGERLPYDAYQTIDWLHDLVSPPCFRHAHH
jgi:chloride channel 3/4/5